MPELVTLDQAATELAVDRRTLQRWVKAGKLRQFRGGIGDRKVYLDLRELRPLQEKQPV